jgi:hypothetical protein
VWTTRVSRGARGGRYVVVTRDYITVYESAKAQHDIVAAIPCTEVVRVATAPGDPCTIVLTLRGGLLTHCFKFGLREHATDWARVVGTPPLVSLSASVCVLTIICGSQRHGPSKRPSEAGFLSVCMFRQRCAIASEGAGAPCANSVH